MVFAFAQFVLSSANATQPRCQESLFGASILNASNGQLNQSTTVARAVERAQRSGERIPNTPEGRIGYWVKQAEAIAADPAKRNRLKHMVKSQYVIKEDEIPESYFENQARIARDLGYGTIEVTPEQRVELSQTLIGDQTDSLDVWLDYLFFEQGDENYPMWFKIWTIKAVLSMGDYDVESKKFSKRSRTSVNPFVELNYEALSYVYDQAKIGFQSVVDGEPVKSVLEATLQGGRFAAMYSKGLQEAGSFSFDASVIDGEWIKFEKGSSPLELKNRLYGKSTGWCTAGINVATQQIRLGDFYVYFSNDENGKATIPRAAIRMEGDQIAEIRGRAKGQNMESEIAGSTVLSTALGWFGDEGRKYYTRLDHMQKLTEIEKATDAGSPITQEQAKFLYEFDEEIQSFGQDRDERIEEIRERRDRRADYALLFGVQPDEVALDQHEALRGGKKVYWGSLEIDLDNSSGDIDLPERVYGDVKFISKEGHAENNVTYPTHIFGDLIFQGRQFNNVSGIEYVRGNMRVSHEHYLFASLLSVTLIDFDFPVRLDGELSLGEVWTLKNVNFPEKLNNDVHWEFRIATLENVRLPEDFGGWINFGKARLVQVTFGQVFRGEISIGGTTAGTSQYPQIRLAKLVTGSVKLEDIYLDDVILPERIEESLSIRKVLTLPKGYRFPGYIALRLSMEISSLDPSVILPRYVGGDLYMMDVTYLQEGVRLPEYVGGSCSMFLKGADGVVFPKSCGKDSLFAYAAWVRNSVLPRTVEGKPYQSDYLADEFLGNTQWKSP